jgi:hypothetical protein
MAHALFLLGLVSLSEGNSETARRLLRQSLTLCLERDKDYEAVERLEALAAVERTRDQLVLAVRLFGAAAALRDAYHLPVPPIDQALRDRHIAALRAAMGEQSFAAAWAEGRAMSLDQAVRVALEERELPITESQ